MINIAVSSNRLGCPAMMIQPDRTTMERDGGSCARSGRHARNSASTSADECILLDRRPDKCIDTE